MNISVYIKQPLLKRARRLSRRRGSSLSKFIEHAVEKAVQEDVPSVAFKKIAKLQGVCSLGGNALQDAERYDD